MSRCTGWIRPMQNADLSRVADIWLQECIREYAFVCTDFIPRRFARPTRKRGKSS